MKCRYFLGNYIQRYIKIFCYHRELSNCPLIYILLFFYTVNNYVYKKYNT